MLKFCWSLFVYHIATVLIISLGPSSPYVDTIHVKLNPIKLPKFSLELYDINEPKGNIDRDDVGRLVIERIDDDDEDSPPYVPSRAPKKPYSNHVGGRYPPASIISTRRSGAQNSQLIEQAFEHAVKEAKRRENLEQWLTSTGKNIDMTVISTEGRRSLTVEPGHRQKVKQIQNDQVVFEEATRYLVENHKLSPTNLNHEFNFEDWAKRINDLKPGLMCDTGADLSCPHPSSPYRTVDGSCNNLRHPTWGQSFRCLNRLLPPDYADRVSSPRVSANGGPLPPPRQLSNSILGQRDVAATYTHMVMQWGQFLDHDLSLTPMSQVRGRRQALQCCPRAVHPECLPMFVPPGDPFYSNFPDRTCLNFVRSSVCSTCRLGQRHQINQVTSYIDASQIYGSTANTSDSLRIRGGLLLTTPDANQRPVLPLSIDPLQDQCTMMNQSFTCFRAGDLRVNQHPALTSLHIPFYRQHNRFVVALRQMNSHWSDDRLYEEVRKIIGAQMQVITYKEFLPVVLGEEVMDFYDLKIRDSRFTKYDPDTNAAILTEFSTAAYRFGHSLVDGRFFTIKRSGQHEINNLRDIYFNPESVAAGNMDDWLRGLVAEQPLNIFDPNFHDDVRNFLYRPRTEPAGGDLGATNINRGRDHGIPGYVNYINHCFGHKVRTWDDLSKYITSDSILSKLRQAYKYVEDIDLFVGGLSEQPVKGGIIGPTFACILGIQFNHLKFGDRFWFEHAGEAGSFTSGQIATIRKTTLAKIICENGNDFPLIHRNVFLIATKKEELRPCEELPDIDLTQWKDGESSGHDDYKTIPHFEGHPQFDIDYHPPGDRSKGKDYYSYEPENGKHVRTRLRAYHKLGGSPHSKFKYKHIEYYDEEADDKDYKRRTDDPDQAIDDYGLFDFEDDDRAGRGRRARPTEPNYASPSDYPVTGPSQIETTEPNYPNPMDYSASTQSQSVSTEANYPNPGDYPASDPNQGDNGPPDNNRPNHQPHSPDYNDHRSHNGTPPPDYGNHGASTDHNSVESTTEMYYDQERPTERGNEPPPYDAIEPPYYDSMYIEYPNSTIY